MSLTQMPETSVTRLLAAKPGQLDSWTKTIRNAIKAAERDGISKFVGFTTLAYFISDNPNDQGIRFECRADGTVWEVSK